MQVLALITTFFPNIEVIKTIENIKKQVDLVIIVDNGSAVENLKFLQSFKNDPQVKLILNQKNMGIAWSCNFAAKFMLENSFSWLLTIDQDSLPKDDYISEMLQIKNQIEKTYISKSDCKIGLICPTYFYESTGILQRQNKDNTDFCKIQTGMSSGSLINRRVFEKAIFCQEKLFVDYFDLEFHLAVQNSGFEIFEASKIILNHKLGNICKKTILGKTFIPTNYPAFRRYYQARNRIFVYSKYWKIFPKFCLKDLKSNLMDIVKMYLVEDKKITKTKAILLGFYHGITNKYQNPSPNFD